MKGDKKVCPQCGEEFFQKHGKQKYCSANCQVRHHQPTYKLEEKICPVCGKSFLPKVTWQIYCSPNCRFAKEKLK